MKQEALQKVLEEAQTLNISLESKNNLDFNELLSHIYRQGIIKALSNRDVKYGRIGEIQNKAKKLESKFAGFKLYPNKAEDIYIDETFYRDIKILGEVLGYELGSGKYYQKYAKLKDSNFPLYFGWFSQSVLVYMKNEPTNSNIEIGNLQDNLNNLSKLIPGKCSEFQLSTDILDSQVVKSMLVYFAEGAMPKDTEISKVKLFLSKITESLT